MMEYKYNNVFLGFNLLLLVMFIELITTVFNLGGKVFIGELLLLGIFMFVALVLMLALFFDAQWSFPAFMIFFAVNLINIFFIYFNYQTHLLSIILITGVCILGLITSIVNTGTDEEDRSELEDNTKEEHAKILLENELEGIKDSRVELAKEFEPGKYVGSETGTKYHVGTCDWAKRINKKKQVWFNDKAEAKKKGYKACSCIK